MAIIVNNNTKVAIQGITGGQGKFHTARMKEYGTNIVADEYTFSHVFIIHIVIWWLEYEIT